MALVAITAGCVFCLASPWSGLAWHKQAAGPRLDLPATAAQPAVPHMPVPVPVLPVAFDDGPAMLDQPAAAAAAEPAAVKSRRPPLRKVISRPAVVVRPVPTPTESAAGSRFRLEAVTGETVAVAVGETVILLTVPPHAY